MARVLFANTHYSQPIGTAFRRQVKIGDFRKLFLQQRDEHFIECHAEHRRFIRRFAGVGAVVDRRAAAGEALDGEHRESRLFVVVAGVVAVGAFQRCFIRVDVAFQHDFRRSGHLQFRAEAVDQLGPATAQQSGKLVFRQAVRDGRYCGQ